VTLKVSREGDVMSKENLRKNPPAIAEYLTEIFEKNDLCSILDAIKFVVQAQNVKALAESTGMRRDGLYKTFGGRKDPQLGRILRLFEGLDVRIVVKPLPARERPPRPKLGRPLSSPKRRRESSETA
jgi:probable addiction module antidote protein